MEVRVTLTEEERMAYAVAEPEERYRVAATARTKLPVVRALVERHKDDQILVIGAYIDQLHQLGEFLDAPIVQGSTTNRERERLFEGDARNKPCSRQNHPCSAFARHCQRSNFWSSCGKPRKVNAATVYGEAPLEVVTDGVQCRG